MVKESIIKVRYWFQNKYDRNDNRWTNIFYLILEVPIIFLMTFWRDPCKLCVVSPCCQEECQEKGVVRAYKEASKPSHPVFIWFCAILGIYSGLIALAITKIVKLLIAGLAQG